mgnify:FL=1
MRITDLHDTLFPPKEMYLLSCEQNGRLPLIDCTKRHYASKARYENLHLMDEVVQTPLYGFPVIQPYNGTTDFEAIAYGKRNKHSGKGQFVHFFADDYTWANAIWNRMEQTLYHLRKFDGMFAPDFSIYIDRPKGFNLMQLFKNRVVTFHAQSIGYTVIPTVSFGDVDSLGYCFEGLPNKSVLGICDTGLENQSHRLHWEYGICALEEMKQPTLLIVYGEPIHVSGIQTPMIFIPDEHSKFHRHGKI